MRIKEKFATDRKSEIKIYKPKYFIASEGSNSEPMYFEGLNNSIITENITIINILRDYASLCNSHPSFIVKMLKEFILNVTADEITVLELKNKKKENLNDLFLKLFKSEVYKDLAENFPLYFEAQDVTYSKTVDKLNIVIDRDKQNFKDFEEYIFDAIKREKAYKEDIKSLKNELGSNVGILINEMLSNK